jgi:hypothetical protein
MNPSLPTPKWIIHFWRGEVWYYCEDDVVFDSHDGAKITIPAYFLHNGGSIPWVFTSGLKPNGLMLTVYALHDYIYTKDFPHQITRKHADKLLYQYGRLAGYNWFKLQAIYSGVQMGGWAAWKKHEARFYAPNVNLIFTKQ